jgi:phosphopantothenoylcysteine decarboxylase/phosphopantothenate--cysteine ligase
MIKVLITGGATCEPIDQVRVITNISTGKTAAIIADAFSQAGCDVTYVRGVNAVKPTQSCRQHSFDTHASLDQLLTQLLAHERYAVVIHLAAVSDYSLALIQQGEKVYLPEEIGKISSGEDLHLTLKPTKKIIHHLKDKALNPDFTLVAFKLTATHDVGAQQEAINKLAKSPAIDFIVHNDIHEIHSDLVHPFTVYCQGVSVGHFDNATYLSRWLVKHFTSKGWSKGG